MDLQDYRKEIDAIDEQLVALFQRRMDVASGIAAYKQEHHLPVLDSGREQEKLNAVCAKVRPDLRSYAQQLYTTLFSLSRAYQDQQMKQK